MGTAMLSEVEQAEADLLEAAENQETDSPRDLRRRAKNGHSAEVVSLAFWRLLNRGELELDRDRRVHRVKRS
jgi:hypothetical protein